MDHGLEKLCAVLGIIGSWIAHILGGWDLAVETLVIFMGIDFFSGLAVAGIFKKSKKTETGGLESKAGFKGLCRKAMTLIFVIVGYRLDLLMGIDYVRNAVIIGFCVNEAVSIVENAGMMGLPLPKAVINAVEMLKKKADIEEVEHENHYSRRT